MAKKGNLVLMIVALSIALVMCAAPASAWFGDTAQQIITPSDYGNGILYFSNNNNSGYGDIFAQSLSTYLTNHPNLHVTSITTSNLYTYGKTDGYIVLVEDKNITHQ
jgi:hypothetical protein